MPLTRRRFLAASAAAAAALPRWALAEPLWPGSPYTKGARAAAMRRGLDFIYSLAKARKNFTEHGDDLMWCFATLSLAAADADFKQRTWRMGQELARRWRRANPRVPADASADDVYSLVSGSYGCELLGFPDARMKSALERAAAGFPAADFLYFDPAKEGVPADIPDTCARCRKEDNRRGALRCDRCREKLTMRDPYDILCDALIATYTGERYGVLQGARFSDVTQWLPRMRPYRGPEGGANESFIKIAYAVTHIVYTFNDYCRYRLKPEWLPDEYAFLKANFRQIIADDDPEALGEFIDTLKSFGMTEADPLIQDGVVFLMKRQLADGSWGDPKERDVYTRYHSTWTAINGLMDYAWAGEQVSFPEALRRAGGEPG